MTRTTVTRIIVDGDRCEGTACAPEVFELDDDGELHLLRETVEIELEPRVQDAVRACPVAAHLPSPNPGHRDSASHWGGFSTWRRRKIEQRWLQPDARG